jgi:ribosomal protein S18 acetylase RimI-like enzyme
MPDAARPRGSHAGFDLAEATGAADYAAARVLFEEYAAQLNIDLCFQGFAAELTRLADIYGAPSGCLIVARKGDATVGCGGVRKLRDDACEMKRLYVRPQARGENLGRILAQALVTKARSLGYTWMFLDTLKDMIPARALYRSLGFRETRPYYHNPSSDAVYMELDLRIA